MTGLPEYRNGGLFVDAGVLVPIHNDMVRYSQLTNQQLQSLPYIPGLTIFLVILQLQQAHEVHSEVIVEWRALTVCLLDSLYKAFLELTGVLRTEFSFMQVIINH